MVHFVFLFTFLSSAVFEMFHVIVRLIDSIANFRSRYVFSVSGMFSKVEHLFSDLVCHDDHENCEIRFFISLLGY